MLCFQEEVFHKSDRPEIINLAAAPYNCSSTNVYYVKCYTDYAGITYKSKVFWMLSKLKFNT